MTPPGLQALLAPSSIAVVGASQDATKIRGRVLKLLVEGGFTGRIHPVNPSSREIQGLPAFPDMAALPAPVDLALIAVPAPQVMPVLEDCSRAGTKAAVIFSAGSNHDAPGERLHDHVAALARRTGMRILGPNAEGFFDSVSGLLATFSPTIEHEPLLAPLGGRRPVSIVSQSGAMGFAIYSRLRHERVPVRCLVSTGNEADVELLEVADHLVAQGGSAAILLFVEGFKHPERFAAVAARAADSGIPLVIAKIGSSSAGQRAAVSHTAHLTGADTAYDAMFRRYGAIRVAGPEQMYALAAAISAGAQPAGRRAAIVTTSGGAGGWAADLAEAGGLTVPPLDAGFKQRLAAIVPDYGSSENPIDVTARVVEDGGATLLRMVNELAEAPGIDVGLIIASMVVPGRIANLADRLASAFQRGGRPIFFHAPSRPTEDALDAVARMGSAYMSLPGFAFAVGALDDYRQFTERWRARRAEPPVAARPVALPAAAGPLSQAESRRLLTSYRVTMPPEELATTRDAAVAAAIRIGFPVALKIAAAAIAHKTEAGGVALALATPAAVAESYDRILANAARHAPQAAIDGVLVQKMMPPGRELVIGVVRDADFGPLVMLGFGGIYVELLRDVVFAIAPLTRADAEDMIAQLSGHAILAGARGQPPADLAALAALLVDVSRLAVDGAARIAEIDLNPVIVYPAGQGVAVVDSLIVLSEVAS